MQEPVHARRDADAAQADTARTVTDTRGLAHYQPGAVVQRNLEEMMKNSPRSLQQRALGEAILNSPRIVAQRRAMNALQGGGSKPQGDGAMPSQASLAQPEAKPNNTGLPDRLKSGIEALSGMRMDHVRVHYNSARPAQARAHAYAQGSDIHVGPGQERHLPHEAWHVVQQAQGRVHPTMQLHGGVAVNNEPGLEHEATVMGERAIGMALDNMPAALLQAAPAGGAAIVQRWPPDSEEDAAEEKEQIMATLRGHGIELRWEAAGREPRFGIDGLGDAGLARCLSYHGLRAEPGTSGFEPAAIIERLRKWDMLRQWIENSRDRGRGFGYGSVGTAGFPPPSPFQQTYGLNPYAPELHGQPFGSAPQGSTHEQLGRFHMIRKKLPEELEQQRNKSRAYREAPDEVATYAEPPFEKDVYSGQSTMLGPKRVALWKQEKRGAPAHHGPFKGKNWPDQQSQLGKASAQEAVASYNATSVEQLDATLPYEWLHLFAFSMGGQDNNNPQDPHNFIVGTQYANYYHLIWETAAKELAATHPVQITAEPMDVVSAPWRIYRTIRYTITLMQLHAGTFDRPASFLAPKKSVTERISCLGKPQVHANDAQVLKEWILLELGIPSAAYQEAAAAMFQSGQQPDQGSLSAMDGDFSHGLDDVEGDVDGDADLHAALVGSVQDIARQHGVLEHFVVGHADGQYDNCSLLAAFEAAGVVISQQQAQAYRRQMFDAHRIPLTGKLDLAQAHIAAAVAALVKNRVGDRQIVIIHPWRRNEYRMTPVAGTGAPIFLFYTPGHFSPAHLHGS